MWVHHGHMNGTRISVKPTGMIGEYTVARDDVTIGSVLKIERRYNLYRPVTVVYWLASNDRSVDAPHYRTRKEAVEALTR